MLQYLDAKRNFIHRTNHFSPFFLVLILLRNELLCVSWSTLYVHTVAGNIRSFPCLYSTRGHTGTIRFNCILPRKLHPVFTLTSVTPSGKGCLSNRIGHRDIRGFPSGTLTGLSTLPSLRTFVRTEILQNLSFPLLPLDFQREILKWIQPRNQWHSINTYLEKLRIQHH